MSIVDISLIIFILAVFSAGIALVVKVAIFDERKPKD